MKHGKSEARIEIRKLSYTTSSYVGAEVYEVVDSRNRGNDMVGDFRLWNFGTTFSNFDLRSSLLNPDS